MSLALPYTLSVSPYRCPLQTLLRGFPDSPTLKSLKSAFAEPHDSLLSSSPHPLNSSADIWQDAGGKLEWMSWSDNWNKSVRPIVLGY